MAGESSRIWIFPRWRFSARLLIFSPTVLLVCLLGIGSLTALPSIQAWHESLRPDGVVVETPALVSGWGFGAIRSQWNQTMQFWVKRADFCAGENQSEFRARQCDAYTTSAGVSSLFSLAPFLVFGLLLGLVRRHVRGFYSEATSLVQSGSAAFNGSFNGQLLSPAFRPFTSGLYLLRWLEVDTAKGPRIVAWPIGYRLPDLRSSVAAFEMKGRAKNGESIWIAVPYLPHVAVLGRQGRFSP